jgi:hypothetical protein
MYSCVLIIINSIKLGAVTELHFNLLFYFGTFFGYKSHSSTNQCIISLDIKATVQQINVLLSLCIRGDMKVNYVHTTGDSYCL